MNDRLSHGINPRQIIILNTCYFYDVYNFSNFQNHTFGIQLLKQPLFTNFIHLVHTQNFPKDQPFLPPDTHTHVCVSGGKKC